MPHMCSTHSSTNNTQKYSCAHSTHMLHMHTDEHETQETHVMQFKAFSHLHVSETLAKHFSIGKGCDIPS